MLVWSLDSKRKAMQVEINMSSSLVYLHIPKSAGSSHRGYLRKVFGEEGLFWYGLHSEAKTFSTSEVGTSFALGGHRPLTFYPRSLDALYTSVIRDPVERAVSFFNYCIDEGGGGSGSWREQRRKEIIEWQKKGIDSSSLSRSIERCKPFREMISNLQCSYLSRYEPTFEGVLKTLGEESMVIGVFDKLPLFNDFLKMELNFPLDNQVRSNVGRAGYSTDIFSEPGVVNLIRSVNGEHQLLYDFVRLQRGGLYVGAKNIDAVSKEVATREERSTTSEAGVPFNWNEVQLFSKGFLGVAADGTALALVVISNASNTPILVSKASADLCSIGWIVVDKDGGEIAGLRGTVEIDRTIPARDIKIVPIPLCLNRESVQNGVAAFVQFCIVEDGVWSSEKYPLNTASTGLILVD